MSIFTSVGAPVPGIIAERLTYTASFGMCIGLVYAGYLLFRHFGLLVPGKLTWPVVVFAVITVAGFGRTYARTYDWYDHLTLYSHDTQHLTRSTQALQLLGNRIFTNALDESDSTRKQVLLREAMGHFRRSLEIRPTYYTSLMNMATVSQMLHLHDTAQVYFKKCLAYDPNDARNLFNLASSYQATGDTANAIKYYGLAIRTDKNLIVAYTNLSFLYFRRGQLDKSIQINEACLKQNPSEFHPYNNIGKTYFQLGKYELALRFFEKAFEIDPNGDENSLILVAESARRMGDLDKASKAVRLYRQRQAQQGKQIPPTLERQLLNRQ
jgi:tetratricopeptide (TPR) repeat protein